jgi:hypothetical protein
VLGAHSDGVTVTTDTGVLVATVLAGCLALKHLAVLGNTVALALRNAVLAVERLALSGCPGKVVTADLDVVVGELAELVIVHTQELSLLRSTEVHTGDLVDDEREDGTDDEGVCGAGYDVGDLLVDGRRGTGDGTSGKTVVDAVEADDVVRAEDTVEEETNHSSDAVLSEDIEGIINADPEFDCGLLEIAFKVDRGFKRTLGSKVSNNTSGDSKNDGCPRSDETRGGSGSDKTRDGTGTPTDHRPLAGKTPIEKNPGHRGKHSSEVGVPASHGSAEVGTESRATVEAQPSEPQKNGTEGDERDVMRAEVEHHLLLAATEDHRVGESAATGNNLDGTSTSVIESTPLEEPAVDVPGPVGDGAVYDGGPQPDENHHGDQTTALSNATDDNGSSDGAELQLSAVSENSRAARCPTYLVERVQELRNQRRTLAGSTKYALKTEPIEVANEAAGSRTESKRVSPEIPLEGDDRSREHTRPNQGQGGLSASKTGVEEGQTGNHDHDHGRGHNDVGLVTRVVPLVQVLCDCLKSVTVRFTRRQIPRTSGMYAVRARHVRSNNISGYLPESPPVTESVPLNTAGAPVHAYDMLTVFLGVLSCGQERVEVPWVKVDGRAGPDEGRETQLNLEQCQ